MEREGPGEEPLLVLLDTEELRSLSCQEILNMISKAGAQEKPFQIEESGFGPQGHSGDTIDGLAVLLQQFFLAPIFPHQSTSQRVCRTSEEIKILVANICGNSPSKIKGLVSVLQSHMHVWGKSYKAFLTVLLLFLLSCSFGVLHEAFSPRVKSYCYNVLTT